MDSHPVAGSLKQALGDTDLNDIDAVVNSVLSVLDQEKLLYYADPGRLPILNNHGRVLLAILEDPGVTQRALSVYLRVSESNVQKSLRLLLKDGIIVKKRVANRNRYEFDRDAGVAHPDIKRILGTLLPLVSGR
jgi:hypothetical protein